jgi:hypothetical protein
MWRRRCWQQRPKSAPARQRESVGQAEHTEQVRDCDLAVLPWTGHRFLSICTDDSTDVVSTITRAAYVDALCPHHCWGPPNPFYFAAFPFAAFALERVLVSLFIVGQRDVGRQALSSMAVSECWNRL